MMCIKYLLTTPRSKVHTRTLCAVLIAGGLALLSAGQVYASPAYA